MTTKRISGVGAVLVAAWSLALMGPEDAFGQPAAQEAGRPGVALVRAARQGDLPEVARILEKYPGAVNARPRTGSKGLESHYDQRTALHWAADRDDQEMVQLLIAKKADVNRPDAALQRPLHLVTSAAVATLLIEAGAVVDAKDQSGRRPLHAARSAEIAGLLIEHGAAIDAKAGTSEKTPLHFAAEADRLDVATLLIEKGANVHARDSSQRTPLHDACRNGNLGLAAMLIDRGADIGAMDGEGATPLWVAVGGDTLGNPVEKEHARIVRLLVEHGASLDATSESGETLLHLAARHGRVEVARFLIESGLDVNAATQSGLTPLHYAAEMPDGGWRFAGDGSRELALVELLIEAGADVNAVATVTKARAVKRGIAVSTVPVETKVTPLRYATALVEMPIVQLSGLPGESEEMERNVETTNRTKKAIARVLRKHGGKLP
ncbi:MAG: ankyrin repeat domain-containing protein [Pirellulales bacterium]